MIPQDWMIITEMKANGRKVEPGTELSITGQRGRFRFDRLVVTSTSTWIDCQAADGRFRAFHPSKVKTVHVKQQLRPTT